MFTNAKNTAPRTELESNAAVSQTTALVRAAGGSPLHQQENVASPVLTKSVLFSKGKKLTTGSVGTGAADLPRHKFVVPDCYPDPADDSGEIFIYKK